MLHFTFPPLTSPQTTFFPSFLLSCNYCLLNASVSVCANIQTVLQWKPASEFWRVPGRFLTELFAWNDLCLVTGKAWTTLLWWKVLPQRTQDIISQVWTQLCLCLPRSLPSSVRRQPSWNRAPGGRFSERAYKKGDCCGGSEWCGTISQVVFWGQRQRAGGMSFRKGGLTPAIASVWPFITISSQGQGVWRLGSLTHQRVKGWWIWTLRCELEVLWLNTF